MLRVRLAAMSLYKYVTADRIDVLENELIRFSQPSVLNDPWDTRPHVERLITDYDLEELSKPLTDKPDDELVNYISEIIEKEARVRNLGDVSLEEIKQALIEGNKQFPGELRAFYEGVFAETLTSAKEVLAQAHEYIPQAIDKALGILSLTKKPDHPLMWSHYAATHSGFVLVFNETHEFFSSALQQSDDVGGLHRIRYCSERPKFDPLIDMSRLEEMENSEYFISWMDKVFFTKSQEWEYEQEWRIINSLKHADKILTVPSGDVYLFHLPSSCIEGVILGQNMAPDKKEKIIEFMSFDDRYKHTQLLQARSSTAEFKIEFSEIPRITQ